MNTQQSQSIYQQSAPYVAKDTLLFSKLVLENPAPRRQTDYYRGSDIPDHIYDDLPKLDHGITALRELTRIEMDLRNIGCKLQELYKSTNKTGGWAERVRKIEFAHRVRMTQWHLVMIWLQDWLASSYL